MFVLGSVSFTPQTGVKLYYFKYNLGREELWAAYLLSMAIASGLGVYLTPYDQIGWIFAWSMLGALGGALSGAILAQTHARMVRELEERRAAITP